MLNQPPFDPKGVIDRDGETENYPTIKSYKSLLDQLDFFIPPNNVHISCNCYRIFVFFFNNVYFGKKKRLQE